MGDGRDGSGLAQLGGEVGMGHPSQGRPRREKREQVGRSLSVIVGDSKLSLGGRRWNRETRCYGQEEWTNNDDADDDDDELWMAIKCRWSGKRKDSRVRMRRQGMLGKEERKFLGIKNSKKLDDSGGIGSVLRGRSKSCC